MFQNEDVPQEDWGLGLPESFDPTGGLPNVRQTRSCRSCGNSMEVSARVAARIPEGHPLDVCEECFRFAFSGPRDNIVLEEMCSGLGLEHEQEVP